MSRTTSEIVIPAALDPRAHATLVEALYRVHCEVFDGVSRDDFVHYVVDSPADDTQLLVHRDENGEVIGYMALHQFRRSLNGKPVVILRSEMGTLREHRGRGSNTRWGVSEIMRIAARNPGTPMYLLACLVHPSSYYLLSKVARKMWPHRNQRPEGELLE